MAYPSLNVYSGQLKLKIEDDEVKETKNGREENDQEIVLKTLEIDNKSYEKNYKKLNKIKKPNIYYQYLKIPIFTIASSNNLLLILVLMFLWHVIGFNHIKS